MNKQEAKAKVGAWWRQWAKENDVSIADLDAKASSAIESLKQFRKFDDQGNYLVMVQKLVGGAQGTMREFIEIMGVSPEGSPFQYVDQYEALTEALSELFNWLSNLEGRWFIDTHEETLDVGLYYREEVVG